MKCYCCDKELTENEINYNEEMRNYEPCVTCLEIALDAAYSGGFMIEDDPEFVILDEDWDEYGDDLQINQELGLVPHPDQRWPY